MNLVDNREIAFILNGLLGRTLQRKRLQMLLCNSDGGMALFQIGSKYGQ